MNIGIFGGTFNPPHIGHLILAQSALDEFKLDRVLFVPANVSPFKTRAADMPPAEQRAEMVELAVSDNKSFAVEYTEVLRGGVSYSVDTLRHVKSAHPESSLFLLMGADTLHEFSQWKDPDEIAVLVQLCVAVRPGHQMDRSNPYASGARVFPMPLLDVSASDIRKRVREGRSIQYLVPWPVKVFIEAHGLYRT